jgi:AraC family transcriptional regulator of adaptative response / DNA-3-methyladenine glycosylase II
MIVSDLQAHAAVEAHDRRFDGLFFTGVTSTGIYCRCVCPARVPKRENRRFFPTAAAAEKAGFRPCLLCRPELAPGLAPIDATHRLAHDALKRIEAGALELQGLEGLAADLGVTSRHLRRATIAALGAAPIDLAQTHRLLTAKRLLADTALSMTEIAFASGFQSVRRFNAVFRERYGMAPSRVRRRGGRTRAATLTLNFAARGAFDAAAPLRDLALHAVDGVEAGHDGGWARSLRLGPHAGWIVLRFAADGISAEISEGLFPAVRQIVAAVRGAFDLDSDIEAIAAALGRSFPEAAPVRLPGALDAFEATARTIIGQQVTLAAARTLAGRIVERFGEPIETPFPGVTRLFPSAERLAQARADQISALGMPRKRGETLRDLARAVADEKIRLARGAVAVGRAGLAGLAGVGPWTIEYAALRALGDPDAFPGGDAVLKAAFEGDVARASEAWRPWRGYAAALLWRRNHAQRIAA